jgi:hypothetical protein
MNIAAINTRVIHQSNTGDVKQKRRHFLQELGLALVHDHLADRSKNFRLSNRLRNDIRFSLGESSNDQNQEHVPKKKQKSVGRCGVCFRSKDRKCKKMRNVRNFLYFRYA